LDLQSEPVVFGNRNSAAVRKNLRLNGATESEIAYLVDSKQRVELNAMTSPQLIELIEEALVTNGVGKVIPNASTLAAAFRSRVEYMRAQKAVGQAIVAARRRAGEVVIPDDLAERVAAYLKAHPAEPWENAVRAIADGAARRPAK
jgi:hypothetical protein